MAASAIPARDRHPHGPERCAANGEALVRSRHSAIEPGPKEAVNINARYLANHAIWCSIRSAAARFMEKRR
jgi:hypothetical protein